MRAHTKKMAVILFALFMSAGASAGAKQKQGREVSFSVTDERKLITRSIDKDLLLRVVKERSVGQQHFGWSVEVVRKPYRRTARNLLIPAGVMHGAIPSQVFAWHVGGQEFPPVRELGVRGFPVKVRIELVNPVVEGDGPDKRFVSGEIKISWQRNGKRAPGR